MKKTTAIILILLTGAVISAVAFEALAQTQYIPLQPLPGMSGGQGVRLPGYMSALYKFGVIFASVLAVLMIVIGGVLYITAAGNMGKVEEAKDYIWQAVIGLLIVLGSYMIINTVNPNLVSMSLNIPNVPAGSTGGASGTWDTNDANGAENTATIPPDCIITTDPLTGETQCI